LFYTIYKTTNKINGKYYIGKHKTSDLNDGYMGSGKLLRRAITKYGIENFTKEILHVFDNEKEMNDKEKELVVICEDSYNLCPGGHGGFGYINSIPNNPTHTPEFCRSISPFGTKFHIETGKTNGWFSSGGNRSKELGVGIHNPKIRGSFKGFKHSQETRQKLSNAAKENSKGPKNSQYGTMWITNEFDSIKIKRNSSIPNGWRVGRIIKKTQL